MVEVSSGTKPIIIRQFDLSSQQTLNTVFTSDNQNSTKVENSMDPMLTEVYDLTRALQEVSRKQTFWN